MTWQGGKFVSNLAVWWLTATVGWKCATQYQQGTQKEIPGQHCGHNDSWSEGETASSRNEQIISDSDIVIKMVIFIRRWHLKNYVSVTQSTPLTQKASNASNALSITSMDFLTF